MDKADALLAALATACAATGYTVQVDRQTPENEREFPMLILRSGDEESVAVDESRPAAINWAMRWELRPSVNLFVRYETDPGEAVRAINAAFRAIVAGIDASAIPSLVVEGTRIEASKSVNEIRGAGRSMAGVFSFVFVIDR